MFALIDCNNFYASCEAVFNPKLQNCPLVTLRKEMWIIAF